jgi:Zn-dependent protease with chaperone function
MSQPLTIDGRYFPKGSSRASRARLVMSDFASTQADVLMADGGRIAVEIASLSDRIGGIDRRIELVGGGLFMTADNDAVDGLSAFHGGFFSRIAQWESFHPRLIAFLVAIVVLVLALYRYGLPAAVSVAVWATPPGVTDIMDASTRRTLDQIIFDDTTLPQERRDKLQASFDDLAAASGTDANFVLLFRDGGAIGANALALPGGTVILTDQFVKLVSHDEAVAVMAHEVTHVSHQHSLRQIYRALGFAAVVALVSGDLGTAAEEILGGGGVLVAMAASREMELEADAGGVELLRKIDIDPANLSSALDKLYEHICGDLPGGVGSCEESGYLSTHPGGADRREALERRIDRR